MDCSMPDFHVHYQLPEFTQTHVHRVGDSIQPSHPLSSPSPPTFNLSQHQSLCLSVLCELVLCLRWSKYWNFSFSISSVQFSSVTQSCPALCDTMDCSTSRFHVHHQLISICPFEYSGLISFRIDWLHLLAVQSTLKSLLQQHSSKPSILQCSACTKSTSLTSIHDY